MAAVQPLWRCEMAFASNPLDVAAVWTEVVSAAGAPLIRAFSSQRGRQHVLGSVEPGRATFTFVGVGAELDPTNTGSPYFGSVDINKSIRIGVMVNVLSFVQALIGAGGWTPGANTNALACDGNGVMTLTATGAGAISASTTGTGTGGFRVQGGNQYSVRTNVQTAVTGRVYTLSITWYNAAGATISTSASVLSGTDTMSSVAAGALVTAPSTAAYAQATYSVAGCVLGEQHKLLSPGILDADIVGTTTPGPITRGGMVPRFTGFVDAVTPKWSGNVLQEIVITATDTLRLLAQTKLPADPFVTRAIQNGATALWPLDDPAGSLTAREVIGGVAARPGMWPLGSTAAGYVFGLPSRASAVSTTTLASAPQVALNGIPDSLQPAGTGVWAIEVWVKTVDVVTWSALYNQGVGVNNGIGLALVKPSGVILVPWLNVTHGGASLTIQGTRVVNDGQWHLVTALFDGTAYRIYVDGVLDISQANAAIDPASPGTLFAALNGSISCATIYKNGMTDMSAGAILKNYQTGSQYFTTPEKSGSRMADALGLINFPNTLYAIPFAGSDLGQSNIAAPTSPPGTVKSYLDAVALAEAGMILARTDGAVVLQDRAHQVNITPTLIFGDGSVGGEIPYRQQPDFGLDNVDLFNASTVTMAGGKPQTWSPGINAVKYGVTSSLDESGLISAGGDSEALARAQYNVAVNASPLPRWRSLTSDVLPNLTTLGGALVLNAPNQAVELGAQVTVNRRPPLSSTVAMIEGINETVDLDHWQVTLHVATADTQPYWVLGTSALGTNTRLFW